MTASCSSSRLVIRVAPRSGKILELMAHTTRPPCRAARGQPETRDHGIARRVINDIYIDEKVKDYIVGASFAPPANRRRVSHPGQGLHPTRRFAARDHRPHARRQSVRLSQRPRLRHSCRTSRTSAWMFSATAASPSPTKPKPKTRRARRSSRRYLMNCRCRELCRRFSFMAINFVSIRRMFHEP